MSVFDVLAILSSPGRFFSAWVAKRKKAFVRGHNYALTCCQTYTERNF